MIYDLAQFIAVRNSGVHTNYNNYILNIKCSDDHMIMMENEYGTDVLKNGILEMIKNEL